MGKETDRKYRIRLHIRDLETRLGYEWKKQFLNDLYYLLQASKAKLEKYMLAYVGHTDRVRIISVSDMRTIMERINIYRPADAPLQLEDMYHPDVRDEELARLREMEIRELV